MEDVAKIDKPSQKVTLSTESSCPSIFAKIFFCLMEPMKVSPVAVPAKNTIGSSGLDAIQCIGESLNVSLAKVCKHSPVLGSKILTVWSSLPVMILFPLLLNFPQFTGPPCPPNTFKHLPDSKKTS
jgi:hypothetical protein